MNPPFLPISFPPGPPTAPKWESGPLSFVPPYNGFNQTAVIQVAKAPPPAELGPGPADPGLSSARGSYTASGYGPLGQGTIGVGNPVSVPSSPPPAQVRFFMGQDGNLYVLDNTDKAYVIQASALVPVPAVYSPTK